IHLNWHIGIDANLNLYHQVNSREVKKSDHQHTITAVYLFPQELEQNRKIEQIEKDRTPSQSDTHMTSLGNSSRTPQSRLNLPHMHNSVYSNNFEHAIIVRRFAILVFL